VYILLIRYYLSIANQGCQQKKCHRQYSHRTEDASAEVGSKSQTYLAKKKNTATFQAFDVLIQIQG